MVIKLKMRSKPKKIRLFCCCIATERRKEADGDSSVLASPVRLLVCWLSVWINQSEGVHAERHFQTNQTNADVVKERALVFVVFTRDLTTNTLFF